MSGQMRIYRGLPGSGKTTIAEKSVAKWGGRIVGRDHIRHLLGAAHRWTYNPAHENEVSEIQERLIIRGLESGQVVHVDDMNLREKYIKRLLGIADELDADYEIIDLSYVDVEACVARDAARPRPVGAEVIVRNYERYVKGKPWPLHVPETTSAGLVRLSPRPYTSLHGTVPVILVDIDGTVALHDGVRGHHDYGLVHLDQPNKPVIEAVRGMIARGHYPIFVSGRPDSCAEATRMWVHKHVGVGAYGLFMRATGDHRPDYIVKLEIFDREIRDNYDVKAAFDDRNQVVRMYRELGISVFQVAPGNF